MAAMFDFSKAHTISELRRELTALSKNDKRFNWLKELIELPLDKYIADKSPDQEEVHRLAVWRVEENIQEASRLLNSAMEYRSDALSLETQAINTVLDLQLADQLHSSDLAISLMNRLASEKLAEAAPPDFSADQMRDRYQLIANARATKLGLLDIAGGPLNYRRRIEFAREIFLDTIRSVYRRLYAIRVGAEAHFGLSNLTKPPPWDSGGGSVEKLIIWLREVLAKIDESSRTERIVDLVIHASTLGVKDIKAQLGHEGDTTIQISLNWSHIGNFDSARHAARLVGISIAPTLGDISKDGERELYLDNNDSVIYARRVDLYRQRMQRASFTINVEFPEQNSNLADLSNQDRSWRISNWRRGGVGAWCTGSAASSLPLLLESQFQNINPIGQWTVTIARDVIHPDVVVSKDPPIPRYDGAVPQKELGIIELVSMHDIAFRFRLAIRERQ